MTYPPSRVQKRSWWSTAGLPGAGYLTVYSGSYWPFCATVFFFKSIAPFYYPCFTFRQALYGFFFRLELYSSWQPWSRIQTAWGGDYAAMQRRQHRREVRKQGFFFIGTNSGAESICIYRPAPLVVLCDKCTHTHTQEEPGLVREEWMEDAARKHNCNLCLSSFSFLPPSSFENEDR